MVETAVARSNPATARLNGPAAERPDRLIPVATPIATTTCQLEVRLLGRVELSVAGREVRLASRSAQALIAVLALRPRVRTREAVAAEIWPDGDGSGTSASLRQALWLVRSAFATAGVGLTDYLEIDAEVIGFRGCAPLDVDVVRFETALRDPASGPEQALALYQGDLTECLALECFAVDRERLSDAFEDALAIGAERRLLAGDLDGARVVAERLLARDPLREEAHTVLLRVHGRLGSRSQVIRQYRRVTDLLERELEVEPLPETQAAYRAALADALERSRIRAASVAFGGDPVRAARPSRPDDGIAPIARP
jgi:DNA-binding SARP family transcriptional activator